MFRKATENIVENCGSVTLHAITDLNSAERFKPLCIVEKKKSFWPFKKPSMDATFANITDMLKKDSDKEAIMSLVNKREFTLLKQFEESPTIKISGHLSAKIAKECGVDFKADDKMTLVLKLGDIEKNEVSWEKLRKKLEHAELDVENEQLFLNAKHSSRTSLCVVIESLTTKDDGSVQEGKSLIVSADANVDIGAIAKTAIIPKIHPKGSIDRTQEHSFTIPPRTVLAYSCVEISFTPDGSVVLHPICDTLDNGYSPMSNLVAYDIEDGSLNVQAAIRKIRAEFEPLIKSDKFIVFGNKLKSLLVDATENELWAVNILLHHANTYIGGSSGKKSMLISILKGLLGGSIKSSWRELVELLGFVVPTDTSSINSSIEFPVSDNHGMLRACMGLVESLTEIDSVGRKLLPLITADHIKMLRNIVESQLDNKDISLKDPAFQSMVQQDSSTLNFLTNCGFLESVDGGVLTFTERRQSYLLDMYAVLYILSGGK